MNKRTFKLAAVMIGFTITVTVTVQVYWNLENYQILKQRFINDMQSAFDNAVNTYYTELTRTNIASFSTTDGHKRVIMLGRDSSKAQWLQADSALRSLELGQLAPDRRKSVQLFFADSLLPREKRIYGHPLTFSNPRDTLALGSVTGGSAVLDPIKKNDPPTDLSELITRVIIAVEADSIDMQKLKGHVAEEFSKKGFDIEFDLTYLVEDRQEMAGESGGSYLVSRSSYIPAQNSMVLRYNNSMGTILRRGIAGIIISIVVTAAIISALVFLYRVILGQKQLAEIKNDLVNNITHEFKTPIATVMTALEGIEKFNDDQDPKKVTKYLGISQDQLKKLTGMVEKLLETATLDSDRLSLKKEETIIPEMLTAILEKYKLLSPGKSFHIELETHYFTRWVDPFHFENAISNLLDNAIKHGGDTIWLRCTYNNEKHTISISDNGGPIPKAHRGKIFDKFYRIPTGNLHTIKGFGIGLYYTRNIIEKHGGHIHLLANSERTEFRVTF
ncbi:MAG: HAMP domain-containing histidine kinase [Cytophagales bacterium]|nr:HAMP domain-containing histidine kinase [Cytophagales bacterium]